MNDYVNRCEVMSAIMEGAEKNQLSLTISELRKILKIISEVPAAPVEAQDKAITIKLVLPENSSQGIRLEPLAGKRFGHGWF